MKSLSAWQNGWCFDHKLVTPKLVQGLHHKTNETDSQFNSFRMDTVIYLETNQINLFGVGRRMLNSERCYPLQVCLLNGGGGVLLQKLNDYRVHSICFIRTLCR